MSSLKCPICNSLNLVKVGFSKRGEQNYGCKDCNKRFVPGAKRGRPKINNKPARTHRSIKLATPVYEKLTVASQAQNLSIEDYLLSLIDQKN